MTVSQAIPPRLVMSAGDGAGIGAELEAQHLDAGEDAHALRLGLAGEAVHRGHVVRVAAPLLVQDGSDALRLPVVEQARHVFLAVLGAFDEVGLIADRFLLLVDRADLLMHHLGADLHVADRMIAVRFRVALPNLDGMGHQFPHGWLKVVVADHAAGDAGCAAADGRLVDDEDVGTGAAAGCVQHLSEVESGAQTVNAGTNDGIFDRLRN